MKIYIVGCAKSGTTLVRRLFNAFDLKVYNWDEMPYDRFLKSGYDVAKRRKRTVFSYDLSKAEIEKQLEALKGCKIVNVVRFAEDVCKNNRVTFKRWDSCIEQSIMYSEHIDCTIGYEFLIDNPDKVQGHVADKLELDMIRKWSEYPDFIDISSERASTHLGNYKLRPIGADY